MLYIYEKLRVAALRFDEKGQSTAEYSLVILGAAGIAMLLVVWASDSGSIGNMFESVIQRVTSMG